MIAILAKLFAFADALQAGKTLSDPAKWADRAKRSGYLVTFLSSLVAVAVAVGAPLEVGAVDLRTLASGLLVVLGLGSQAANLIHVGANPNAQARWFDKLSAFGDVLSRGKALADPALWSDRARLVGSVLALLQAVVGLALAYGYSIQASESELGAIAAAVPVVAGVIAQCSNLLHVAANPNAGRVPPAHDDEHSPYADESPRSGPLRKPLRRD